MIDYFEDFNFDREEFSCKCGCGFDTIDFETLQVVQLVREHFEQPVRITSACRCPDYNEDVGGASSSQHVKGRACDIQVANTSPIEVYEFLDSTFPDSYGLGKYPTFTHIDTRSWKARW